MARWILTTLEWGKRGLAKRFGVVEKSGKKGGRKKGRGRGFWILASLVLDYLLGVMVRVSRFVSEGCCRLAWCVSDAAV